MNKKNSIVQIARDANCSTATISRYFNGGYVSKEMQARIKKSIEKLDYTLSPIAKLMRGQSNEIYIILDPRELAINNKLIPMIVEKRKKFDSVFFSFQDYESPNYFSNIVNIVNRNPKAIVIINHTNDDKFFEFVIKHQKGTNFYILGGKDNYLWNQFNFPFYFIDEQKIFATLIAKMIRNQDNVCFIGIDYKNPVNNLWYYKDRFLAFQETTKKFTGKKAFLLLKENTMKEAIKGIIKMQKAGFNNFICSTHTVYRAFCEVSREDDISNDIGYYSLSDNNKKFRHKLFIPFNLIADDLIQDIEKDHHEKIFHDYKPKII